MKKKILFVALFLGIIIVLFSVYKIITYKEPKPNKVELSHKNFIFNTSEMSYADTIVSIGLDALKIDSVIVVIKPISSFKTIRDNFGEITLKAYIIGNSSNQYVIYLSKYYRKQLIDIVSHELIHLKQYYNKELIVDGNVVIWRNSVFDYSSIKYENRPWEIDAEINKYKVIDYINDKLYNK